MDAAFAGQLFLPQGRLSRGRQGLSLCASVREGHMNAESAAQSRRWIVNPVANPNVTIT
jgi:hypothetical protein